jgi:hypothetical protein
LGGSEGGGAEDQQPDSTERLSMASENGRSTGEKEMEHFSPEDNGKHQQNYSCQADSEKEWQRYKLTY